MSTQHASASVQLGKDTHIRLMVLLFPSVCGESAALAELIVECHSTAKSMCQVTMKIKP